MLRLGLALGSDSGLGAGSDSDSGSGPGSDSGLGPGSDSGSGCCLVGVDAHFVSDVAHDGLHAPLGAHAVLVRGRVVHEVLAVLVDAGVGSGLGSGLGLGSGSELGLGLGLGLWSGLGSRPTAAAMSRMFEG